MKSLTVLLCLLSLEAIKSQTGKILPGHKTLTYSTDYNDPDNHLHIRDTVKFITTDIPWKHQPDHQITVIWKYSGLKLHDSIRKKLFSIGWRDTDSTGAVESNREYWIHPTRNNHYTITEIAPFPSIEFPCFKGRRFNHQLEIYNNWGPWSNLTLYNIYEITGKDSITVSNIGYDCWVTLGRNDSQLGTTFLTTKFNEDIGFVDFNYVFYNNTTLRMTLIKIEQKGRKE